MKNTSPKVRFKILVIENDEDIRGLLRFGLEHAGYDVAESDNGESGLKEAHDQKPDLIILDRILPEVDGCGVCRTLKANPQTHGIPIFMMTALAPQWEEGSGWDHGADEYLPKPFEHNQMLEMIHRHLSKTPRQLNRDQRKVTSSNRRVVPSF